MNATKEKAESGKQKAGCTAFSPFAKKLLAAIERLTQERQPHACGGFTSDDMAWQMGEPFTPQETLYGAIQELIDAKAIRFVAEDENDESAICYEVIKETLDCCRVEQPVARQPHKLEVVGSSPTPATILRHQIAALEDRAVDLATQLGSVKIKRELLVMQLEEVEQSGAVPAPISAFRFPLSDLPLAPAPQPGDGVPPSAITGPSLRELANAASEISAFCFPLSDFPKSALPSTACPLCEPSAFDGCIERVPTIQFCADPEHTAWVGYFRELMERQQQLKVVSHV